MKIIKSVLKHYLLFQGTVLIEGLIIDFMPQCGLHLILAQHRYLWKFLFDVVNKRSQENLLSEGLKKIGCSYLAFQLDCYFKSKKKHYDGTENLRMIGNDFKILEANIDTFLTVFVENQSVSWQSQKSQKLRHILQLYNAWADLAQHIFHFNYYNFIVISNKDVCTVHHNPD
nr:uncharacterized protein LOC124807535 [Hydra vulgaris]